MTLRPSQLPKFRRQLLRHLNDPTTALRSKTSDAVSEGLDVMAANLEASDLFWVQEDMAALAMHAGQELAAARWATADRPSPCGLLFWQGGIGHMDARGVQIPVEACAWGPYRGELLLWLFMSRARLDMEIAHKGMRVDAEGAPPLIPVHGGTLPVGAEPSSLADIDPHFPQPVVAALAAAWLLMQQPQLVDRTRERADKPTARAYTRDGLPSPEVSVVDLRRQYTPQAQEPDPVNGRTYRHRWVVSGHWRNQPYGPEQSLRRQTWIPAYVKGPDGAPLLSTEKVNVWRR